MKTPLNKVSSPIRDQAANTLRRARAVPPGPYRNDLRLLGRELLRLHKLGIRANVEVFDKDLTGQRSESASDLGKPHEQEADLP
jgi:hypothetical protein